jgi:hypothetical protein
MDLVGEPVSGTVTIISDAKPIPPNKRAALSASQNCGTGKTFFSLCRRLIDWLAPVPISELPAPAQARVDHV